MTTNYEEACRRVGAVIAVLERQIKDGQLPAEQGKVTINGYRTIILEMQNVYLGDDSEEKQYLQAEFVLGVIPTDAKLYNPYADPVRGLIGIGPNCEIPSELYTLELTQKPD